MRDYCRLLIIIVIVIVVVIMMLTFLPSPVGFSGVTIALTGLQAFFLPEVFRLIFIAAAMTLFAVFIVMDTFLDMLFTDFRP